MCLWKDVDFSTSTECGRFFFLEGDVDIEEMPLILHDCLLFRQQWLQNSAAEQIK